MNTANSYVSDSLKQKVESVAREYFLTAQRIYGSDKINVFPEIRYNTKGRTAGFCWYKDGNHWIDLNPILLNENPDEMLNKIVPHEMAHHVVHQLYEKDYRRFPKPHGNEWRIVMMNFGLDPDRCHKMDTSTIRHMQNNGFEYVYKCNCSVHNLSKIRHNRIQNGTRYSCNKCKSRLVLDSIKPVK